MDLQLINYSLKYCELAPVQVTGGGGKMFRLWQMLCLPEVQFTHKTNFDVKIGELPDKY